MLAAMRSHPSGLWSVDKSPLLNIDSGDEKEASVALILAEMWLAVGDETEAGWLTYIDLDVRPIYK